MEERAFNLLFSFEMSRSGPSGVFNRLFFRGENIITAFFPHLTVTEMHLQLSQVSHLDQMLIGTLQYSLLARKQCNRQGKVKSIRIRTFF